MINFNYETNFNLKNESIVLEWVSNTISSYNYTLGEINYIFCDDDYLIVLNKQFLNHDTLTDIISFDNTLGKSINGDIFISIERVAENATQYNVDFEEELHRVMIHGIFHYIGFKDKLDKEKKLMREAENKALSILKKSFT